MCSTNVVCEIFVRYHHSNLNDLKDIYLYEPPKILSHELMKRRQVRNHLVLECYKNIKVTVIA
jgi:hypothetical protein